jgi:hypothetical protein
MGLAERSSEAKNQAELTRELAKSSEGKDGFRPALLERFASGGIDTPMHDRRLIDVHVILRNKVSRRTGKRVRSHRR